MAIKKFKLFNCGLSQGQDFLKEVLDVAAQKRHYEDSRIGNRIDGFVDLKELAMYMCVYTFDINLDNLVDGCIQFDKPDFIQTSTWVKGNSGLYNGDHIYTYMNRIIKYHYLCAAMITSDPEEYQNLVVAFEDKLQENGDNLSGINVANFYDETFIIFAKLAIHSHCKHDDHTYYLLETPRTSYASYAIETDKYHLFPLKPFLLRELNLANVFIEYFATFKTSAIFTIKYQSFLEVVWRFWECLFFTDAKKTDIIIKDFCHEYFTSDVTRIVFMESMVKHIKIPYEKPNVYDTNLSALMWALSTANLKNPRPLFTICEQWSYKLIPSGSKHITYIPRETDIRPLMSCIQEIIRISNVSYLDVNHNIHTIECKEKLSNDKFCHIIKVISGICNEDSFEYLRTFLYTKYNIGVEGILKILDMHIYPDNIEEGVILKEEDIESVDRIYSNILNGDGSEYFNWLRGTDISLIFSLLTKDLYQREGPKNKYTKRFINHMMMIERIIEYMLMFGTHYLTTEEVFRLNSRIISILQAMSDQPKSILKPIINDNNENLGSNKLKDVILSAEIVDKEVMKLNSDHLITLYFALTNIKSYVIPEVSAYLIYFKTASAHIGVGVAARIRKGDIDTWDKLVSKILPNVYKLPPIVMKMAIDKIIDILNTTIYESILHNDYLSRIQNLYMPYNKKFCDYSIANLLNPLSDNLIDSTSFQDCCDLVVRIIGDETKLKNLDEHNH